LCEGYAAGNAIMDTTNTMIAGTLAKTAGNAITYNDSNNACKSDELNIPNL
jgi:hypothetical protein